MVGDDRRFLCSGGLIAGLHCCWEAIHVVIQHSEEESKSQSIIIVIVKARLPRAYRLYM